MGTDRHIDSSSAAISADGTIYFGTNIGNMEGGEIIAINPDGTERWRKRIANDWVESSPSIAEDGTVYIGGTFDLDYEWGYLHAFGSQESNDPPFEPSITGPPSGNAGTPYQYTFIATDPDNNPVSYYIDWGDDTSTGWTREYASGETVKIKHTWNEQGTYTIRAKAKDTFEGEGPWGELSVTMPRNKIVNGPFLNFLGNHPLLFQLFQRFLNL